MKHKTRIDLILDDVYAIRPLMQGVFTRNIMKYLAYSHTISRCNYRRLIILIFILPSRLLRANIKRIFSTFKFLICIAASRSNLRHRTKIYKT